MIKVDPYMFSLRYLRFADHLCSYFLFFDDVGTPVGPFGAIPGNIHTYWQMMRNLYHTKFLP
jgi:hypothetical protein